MHEADGEEGQQPWQGHAAPQEGVEEPHQLVQLTVHFFSKPGEGAVGMDIWPLGPGALQRIAPPAL